VTAQAAQGVAQHVAGAAEGWAQQEALSEGLAQQGDASLTVFEFPEEKKAAIGQLPSQVPQRLYWYTP
jgi:hypothetical protein